MQNGLVITQIPKSAIIEAKPNAIENMMENVHLKMKEIGANRIKDMKVVDHRGVIEFQFKINEPIREEKNHPFLFPISEF